MFYFTSFLKPGGYRRIGDSEKQTHRAASPDGSPFPQDESETDLFLPSSRTHLQQEAVFHRHWRSAVVGLLFVCNICLFACVVFLLDAAPLEVRQKECGRLLGQWLPGWQDGVEYEVQRFKGNFGLQSPFTGVGPEVDAAWYNLTDGPTGGAIGITKEQWEAVNEHHDFPVMLDEDHGTGRYLASLDVFHELHCVDLLRKSIHREYYDEHESSFAGAPQHIIEGHLEHCVEILRQTLMCHGDMSLLTYNWVQGRDVPYPNFNTVHTCKKWETLTRWNMRRHAAAVVGEEEYRPPMKPEGVVGMKVPPP